MVAIIPVLQIWKCLLYIYLTLTLSLMWSNNFHQHFGLPNLVVKKDSGLNWNAAAYWQV